MLHTGSRKGRKKLTREQAIGRANAKRRRWVRNLLIEKHRGLCHLCGELVDLRDETGPRYASVDHIVPLSKGGADALANLALAHASCNQRKGAGIASQFDHADPALDTAPAPGVGS